MQISEINYSFMYMMIMVMLPAMIVVTIPVITLEGRENNSVQYIWHDFKRGLCLLTGERLVSNRRDRQHLYCEVHHPTSVSLLSCRYMAPATVE